jgi:uncharacterized protein YbjT (DUF2867 family)
MRTRQPILVTGAAGQVGGIGGLVVSILLGRQVSYDRKLWTGWEVKGGVSW